MYKVFLRLFLLLFITIFIIIFYLSSFGIKTNKFNNIIKSEISKLDNRLAIDLKDIFIKLNIKERSFSLNSKNINLYLGNKKQKIANVDLLLSFKSIFEKNNNINKIIINSDENEIIELLKFVRAYKMNVPALYLENSVTTGKIIYNIIIENNINKSDKILATGKIIDSELNILRKKQFKNINFEFEYKNQSLNINNLNFVHDEINFKSKNIYLNTKKDSTNIKGDVKNRININLIKNFLDLDIDKYLSEKISLRSNSFFDITFNNKFKIINYEIKNKIKIDDINFKLKNSIINNYIKDYKNKINFKDGEINLVLSNKDNIDINIISNLIIGENIDAQKFSLKYTKKNNITEYKVKIDLTENEIVFNEIDFKKNKNDELQLDLILISQNNTYEVKKLNVYNSKNKFFFKNLKFDNYLKIKDFALIEANYENKKDLVNDISIKKIKNKINIKSNNFDLSTIIEKSLKNTNKTNFLDIFQNLNSTIDINVKNLSIDNDYKLNNLKGKSQIKNNKIVKTNIEGNFNIKNKFTYTIEKLNGKKVTTIFSDIAEPFVKNFKFIKGFSGGKLDYTSTEIKDNISKSELRIYNFKLKDMPALTKLLSLASLQGIADLATGEGIRFNEFDMFFEINKNLITIEEIYALGPAISILMEGYVEKNKLVSLRGTLVPATTINKHIAKIPLIGNILIGNKIGEGIFGVSFKIKGNPKNLDTRVNPIKTLTPRFITRTLDKIKKSN